MAAVQEDTQQEQEATFDYPVDVQDAGPSQKKVTVTVPRERIEAYSEQTMGAIRNDAALPGFRRGKAPRHVIQKRLGKAMREQVQQDLVRESYEQSLKKTGLAALGDPEFADPESLKLPDEGDLVYSFTVEVQPEVQLPSLDGLAVRRPKIQIRDEHVQQALQNLREQQGSLMPVEDRPVQDGDYLIADVAVRQDGEEIARQDDAELVSRPGRIAGIEVGDFADRVRGMNAGEERTLEVDVPEHHADPKLAGRKAQIQIRLKDIKALQPAEVDEAFLSDLGFSSEEELLNALREQMSERVEADVRGVMRRQVQEYLLNNTQVDLPERTAGRQADRVINRRAVDLLMQGVSRDQVEANLEQIRQGADEEARRELKLFFILARIADERNIDVSDAELNRQVARIAFEQGQRPERMRSEMEKDGTLANLYVQIREAKTLDSLIGNARIEEFEPSPEEQKQAMEAAATGEAGESEDVT